MNGVKSGSGQSFQSIVTVIVKINRLVDSSETQTISDDKRVNKIILRQVVVGFLEFLHLFRIKNVDSVLVSGKRAVLTQKIHEIIAVDRGSFKTDDDLAEGMLV